MRYLQIHSVVPNSADLTISVTDETGQGGACHRYVISGYDPRANPSSQEMDSDEWIVILFQNGPIREVGVNGVTNEALLAVLIDRMECFQRGPFRCEDNSRALASMHEALFYLQKRTRDRLERGVEGTNQS